MKTLVSLGDEYSSLDWFNRWVNDDFAWFAKGTILETPKRFYNPTEYDLVPKPETTKRLIKEKEAELERLRKLHENNDKYYEEKRNSLSKELDQLRQKQLKP